MRLADGRLAKIDAASAASQGTPRADDAIASAAALGLPAGSPIYFDMEGYALDNPACSQTVQTFLSAWVDELHAQGYLAGVYGSAASTMRDLQALDHDLAAPDDVWIADWNGDTSVFGDPYVSDSALDEPSAHPPVSAAATPRPGAASRSTSTASSSTPPSSARRERRRRPPQPRPRRVAASDALGSRLGDSSATAIAERQLAGGRVLRVRSSSR